MPFAASVPAEHRARLRRLRAEFEAAFDLVSDPEDRFSPAYRAADARYRAWIGALDAVAMALLDDVDACEIARSDAGSPQRPELVTVPALAPPIDIDALLRGTDDIQTAADLIGGAPAAFDHVRRSTPKSRAMNVVGADRVARHWDISLEPRHPVGLADQLR